jgi:hypothetical protein
MSRFKTETLAREDNLKGLAQMNTQWAEDVLAHTPHQRVILDMDSSESPVHGQQNGAAYNGQFECSAITLCFSSTNSGIEKGRHYHPATSTASTAGRDSLSQRRQRYQN